jgi:ubiquinone/menaquinone biosynthesis C-methylase UbiE
MALYYPKDYFHNFKHKYTSVSENDLVSIKQCLPPLYPGCTILDLACGSGALGEWLRDNLDNITVVGSDICMPLLKWASFPACQSDAAYLPFKDAAFDGVVAAAAFHHFPNMDTVIKECFRCLKPGGFLLAYDPNKFHPQRFIMMTDPLRYFFYRNGDHALSPIVFKKRLMKEGFRTISIRYLAFDSGELTSLSRLNHRMISLYDGLWSKWLQPFIFPWFVITGIKDNRKQ